MFDPETCNLMNLEERVYRKWEREEKNRILRIANPRRKQLEWRKLFPIPQKPDDSYLEGKIF